MQFEIKRELSFAEKDCTRLRIILLSRRSSNGFREREEEGTEEASDSFSLLRFPATQRVPEGASRERLSQRIRARRERGKVKEKKRERERERARWVSGWLDRTRNTKGANYNDNAPSSARPLPGLGKKFATSVSLMAR